MPRPPARSRHRDHLTARARRGRPPGQGTLRISRPDHDHRLPPGPGPAAALPDPRTGTGILGTARLVQQHHAGLDLDLADAVNVALAAQYRTDAMLTLDRRDFRAIRPLTPHKWFRILPDDL